jgi:hypothetical protein
LTSGTGSRRRSHHIAISNTKTVAEAFSAIRLMARTDLVICHPTFTTERVRSIAQGRFLLAVWKEAKY